LLLLVVIVGVLVALSVPRFIEASNKAKAAEPPRVIGAYESSQLADYVREGRVEVTRVGELGGGTAVGGK
jgi:type II secretory pathway pseudopilin PulG